MFPPYQPKPEPGKPPYLIAHRGISGKAPENTLSSFRRALQCEGIDMIELDVRLTKDRQVIVLHDRTLQRTTTGNGLASSYTLSEIKRYDAGSWFHPRFSAERVPTLVEVLELIGKSRWVNVEIKAASWFRKDPGVLEQLVLETIHKEGYQNHTLVSSFNHQVLANIRAMDKHLPLGVIYNLPYDLGRFPSRLAERVGASVFVCAKRELNPILLRDAQRGNLAVYVYTLNSPREVERIKRLGVAGIISDNADDIVDLVKGSPG